MSRPIHWHGRGWQWQVERPLRACLLHRGSLTARLRSLCAAQCITVRVLREGRHPVPPDEARVLGLRVRERSRVREVCLHCGSGAWVFAHSVIPQRTLSGGGRRLARLGHHPLGAVLFSDPGIQRGPIELARVSAEAMPYAGFAAVDATAQAPAYWGRRSLFYVGERPLLVCEFFLPALEARLRREDTMRRGDASRD